MEYLSSIDVEHDSTIFVPHDWNDIVLGIQDVNGNRLKDGDKIKAGSKIRLIVGHVGGEKIRTPKVLGLPLKEAVKILKKNLLNVSPVEIGDGACIEGIDSSLAKITLQRPACGDEIKIYLVVKKGKIVNFKYEGESCIYSQASASLLSRSIINKPISEIESLLKISNERFKKKINKTNKDWDKFLKLINKNNFLRKDCLLLPVKATIKALKNSC